MTYGVSASLQTAIYQRLSADIDLMRIVDGAVYDALPGGTLPGLYVVLGSETVRDNSDQTGRGAEHDFVVSVVTDLAGFSAAKTAAAAVSDALLAADLSLSRGVLLDIEFQKARARLIGSGDQRRIDMTFRARVEDN